MKILVAGDFCPRYRVAKIFEKEEYEKVLSEIRPLTSKAEYSIVNLECPITKGDETPIVKFGPNLRFSEKGIKAIKWAGFNCVTLANNHFYDYGDNGVANTLQTCEKFDIDSVGGGINISEAEKVLYKVIDDKVLAVINCCEHEFSIATESSAGSNPLNSIQQFYDIKEAKKTADYVLVIVHGGNEYFQLPTPRMVELYRYFIDAGADAVVNHHQHCFSGYEEYQGKPIFYGIGNFCFDNPTFADTIWNYGYIVIIDFNSNNICFDLYPYCQCEKEPSIKLLPEDTFNTRLSELNGIITNPRLLQENINDYYSSCADQYSNIFEPLINRYYLAARRRGWLPSLISKKRKLISANMIFCESHRDKILWWFKKAISNL